MADFFGWDVKTVRILWVVATVIWSPIMIGAYVLMAWLLDAKPRMDYGRRSPSETSMPGDPMSPRHRFIHVKSRFDRLEARRRAYARRVRHGRDRRPCELNLKVRRPR